ncbi:hypothetical protein ACHAWF_007997 [Thalassiosira exigua]
MKRRMAPPNLLSLAAVLAAASSGDGGGRGWVGGPAFFATATSWLDEHHLVVRPEMASEVDYLMSTSEFAPPDPSTARRRMMTLEEEVRWEDREEADDVRPGGRRAAKAGCSSPLTVWTTARIREVGYLNYKELYDNKILLLPYVYKHYVAHYRDGSDEHFLTEVQTEELTRRHRDTIAFWSAADLDGTVAADDVLLLSMHGSDLKDDAKLVPAILRTYDFDDMSDVLKFAAKVKRLIEDLPEGYDNPLLTMNAVATRSTRGRGTYSGHDDPDRRTKDSVLVGDGVLRFLSDLGLSDAGPDFVHAHEFAHHLQFRMDMAVPPGAKFKNDDRRKELMADALGGYFLAHDRGANMSPEEIEYFAEASYSTGDCGTGKEDHHGTPAQRRCAAIWGASRAAPDDVPTLDPEAFVRKFDAAYPKMLRLDPRECELVVEEASGDGNSFDFDRESGRESYWKDEFQRMKEEYDRAPKKGGSGAGGGVLDLSSAAANKFHRDHAGVVTVRSDWSASTRSWGRVSTGLMLSLAMAVGIILALWG